MSIIDNLKNTSIYLFSGYGGLVGSLYGFWLENWQQIALALILGFVGSIGGALAKLLINSLNKNINKNE